MNTEYDGPSKLARKSEVMITMTKHGQLYYDWLDVIDYGQHVGDAWCGTNEMERF